MVQFPTKLEIGGQSVRFDEKMTSEIIIQEMTSNRVFKKISNEEKLESKSMMDP